MQTVSRVLNHGRTELAKVIVGQQEMITQCLLTILCHGHALLEGVPGIAKTLVIKAFARLFALDFKRVQCTSDLISLHRGPLFTDLLLADEVNRMPPRTQAALLEAMEERQLTIDGVTHPLSGLFTVFATQNPIEFEGTYPLPEAQLDRFLLKINVNYPDAAQEVSILENHHHGFNPHDLASAQLAEMSTEVLAEAQSEIKRVQVEPALFRYIVEIVRRTRDWPSFSMGASPRAAVSLMSVAKGYAALEERDYMIPDDVKAAARPVLRHRVMLRPEAELEGLRSDQVLNEVIASVEVPK
jgi:MoxR-like ATPase